MKAKKKASYKDFLIFSFWFIAVFGVSYTLAYTFGLVPKEVDETGRETILDTLRQNALETVSTERVEDDRPGDKPTHLSIESIKTDIAISNPDTTDPVLLDEYLTKGIVRYPGSGLLGKGNVLLFGHSSHLAVVHNPAYKALNGIETLKAGDEIKVDSEGTRYIYKVRSVRMAPASEIKVDFAAENLLTISTCNNFGAKEDRYVVEAVFDRTETR